MSVVIASENHLLGGSLYLASLRARISIDDNFIRFVYTTEEGREIDFCDIKCASLPIAAQATVDRLCADIERDTPDWVRALG